MPTGPSTELSFNSRIKKELLSRSGIELNDVRTDVATHCLQPALGCQVLLCAFTPYLTGTGFVFSFSAEENSHCDARRRILSL